MMDQAENLRKKLNGQISKMMTKAIAVVSGKGGVGKSNFSLNFSISLSKKGYRILIIDMDVGMGNLDILMGRSSDKTIVDFLNGSSSLKDIIMDGPAGIKYISGGSGLSKLVSTYRLASITEELDACFEEFDYIIFDMGAGVNEDTLKFLLSVHEVFVITTPEPTSLMDAYSIMKYIHVLQPELPFYIVANRVNSMKEGQETISRLSNVLKKFLDRESTNLGILPDDRSVSQAVRQQIPFTLFNSKSSISIALEDLVTRYIQQKTKEMPSYTPISFVSKLRRFFFER
ncbi:MAG: MinD/ParA family protein [Bacillota bacterium]|nr:MinD/ParA family protein [Bacillota bacterium]